MEMMDSSDLFKQMLDFQKTVFNSSFNTMSVVKNRVEKIMGMYVEQVEWSCDKWNNAVNDWTESYEHGCEALKKKWMTILQK